MLFQSSPCKGFSGLLSAKQSKTDKYQALNRLALRGVWLTLEAYRDDPIPIILFENVPRILNRGRWLLDQITALFRSYGYSVNIDVHDCGIIGNLAQSRKRALLHHFGTVKAIERAAFEDLAKTPGVNAATARAVYDFFHAGA